MHLSSQIYAESPDLSKGVGNQAWSCLDLLDILSQLAERGHASSVRLMLERPLNQCPDILLVGIAQINVCFLLPLVFSLIDFILQSIGWCIKNFFFGSLPTISSSMKYLRVYFL